MARIEAADEGGSCNTADRRGMHRGAAGRELLPIYTTTGSPRPLHVAAGLGLTSRARTLLLGGTPAQRVRALSSDSPIPSRRGRRPLQIPHDFHRTLANNPCRY